MLDDIVDTLMEMQPYSNEEIVLLQEHIREELL